MNKENPNHVVDPFPKEKTEKLTGMSSLDAVKSLIHYQ